MHLRWVHVWLCSFALFGGLVWWTIVHIAEPTLTVGIISAIFSALQVIQVYRPWKRWLNRHQRSSTQQARSLSAASRMLKKAVTQEMDAEEKQRRLQDPYPLQVRWMNTRRPVIDHWQAIHGVPGQGQEIDLSGKLSEISDRFARVPSRRLVVLGDPGAGKTILSLALVLQLLELRSPDDPVPVRIPMSTWNPETTGLRNWIVQWLTENYDGMSARTPAGTTFAREIVDAGRVLPVLDGLDEIPQLSRITALVKLNRELSRGDPLVLTCRPGEYEEVVAAASGDVLTAAAVIELCPLTPKDLLDYLRITTTQSRATKWDEVFTDLTRHPDGPVAQALSTPLMAWLARTTYNETPEEPSELLATNPDGTRLLSTREEVEGRLLGRLIPAVYASDSAVQSTRRWTTTDAQRWLGFLAVYLHRLDTYDIAWWRLHQAVSRLVFVALFGGLGGLLTVLTIGFTKWIDLVGLTELIDPSADPIKNGVVAGLAVGITVALSLPAGQSRRETGLAGHTKAFVRRFSFGSAIALPLGFLFPLICGLAAGFAPSPDPSRVRIRFRGIFKQFISRFGFGFTVGLCIGFFTNFFFGFLITSASSLALGLMSGAIVGFASGLTVWFVVPADVGGVTTPRATMKQDRIAKLTFGLAFGLVVGFALALISVLAVLDTLTGIFGPEVTEELWSPVVLAVLVAVFGVLYGLLLGFVVVVTSTWGVFQISRCWLALRRRLPWRLMRFLADAHQLGVLRQVGGIYQFRHARLRDQLVPDALPVGHHGRPIDPVRGLGHRLSAMFPPRVRTSAAVLIVLALLGIFYFDPGRVLSVPAHSKSGSGFVWVNETSTPIHRPADTGNRYLYNSVQAGDITVLRHAVGHYSVIFGGLNVHGGVAHATAYGNTPAFCVVESWYPLFNAKQVVEVKCFDPDSQPVDELFVVNFADNSDGVGRFSYLLADNPETTERYHPSWVEPYDSTGGVPSIIRRSAGRYEVYLPASVDVPAEEQFYQVTAYGQVAHCKLSATPSRSGAQQVACRGLRGEFTDSRFSLSFSWQSSLVGRTDRRYGSYQPSWGSAGMTQFWPGQYGIRVPAIGTNPGHVVVSAFGDSDAYCHIQRWSRLDDDLIAWVGCWSITTHESVDSQFFIGVSW